MLIGIREEDRQLLMDTVKVLKDLGRDLNKNLTRLNDNLEEISKNKLKR